MKTRKILTAIVGIAQSVIAVLIVIFACILYFNFFGIQTLLGVAAESLYFHVLALLVFGFFSLVSGLFLAHEWAESR